MNIPTCSTCGAQQPPRQRFAFTAVLVTDDEIRKAGLPQKPSEANWMIGRAVEGEFGYYMVPIHGLFTSQEKARAVARKLNRDLLWHDEAEAQMLVLRTMPVAQEHLAGLLRRGIELVRKMDQDSEKPDAEDLEEWLTEAEEAIVMKERT